MSKSLRITIADDESRIRDFLWRCLDNLGHQVVSGARTGHELVDQCREYRPDLVISDVKMPDMDGIDAAGEIYRFAAIPVILVSAFHDDDLIQRATSKHILAYLVKPVKESDLGPAITVAMQRCILPRHSVDFRASSGRGWSRHAAANCPFSFNRQ